MENNEGLAELFDGGGQFKTAVVEQLINSCLGPVVDLRPLSDCTRSEQIEACVRAMTSGADVIIGGCLPVDYEGHRVGYPDLLVRGVDRADDSTAYHPVEIKWHKIIERAQPPHDGAEPRTLRYSTLDQPTPTRRIASPAMGFGSASRTADFLQLAHYYRMLEACGFGPAQPLVGVIGTDDLFEEPVLAWADLQTAGGASFLAEQPRGLAAAQPPRALRPRARVSDQDRRCRAAADRTSRTRTRNCWSSPSSTRVLPLPVVGALPAAARPG
jgi:hypothetical protein